MTRASVTTGVRTIAQRRRGEVFEPRCPVVSVGNLAMGGRGKTPTAALVARLLVEAGERPALLSRGYRRRDPVDGVVVVSDGRHILADVDRSGDEPLLLARQVPGAIVLVSEVRATAASLGEEALGATVHVLDDGFQHRTLRRDIDIVIVTPSDLTDRRIPFGRLRSPVSALAQADAVVFDGNERGGNGSTTIDPSRQPLFTLTRSLGTHWWLERTPNLEPGTWNLEPEPGTSSPEPEPGTRNPEPRTTRVISLSAIAQPDRFARALQSAGYDVVESITFRDHHPFRRADLARVADVVRRTSATAVLTTEKDAMRLLPLRPLAVGAPIAAVPLDVTLRPVEPYGAGREPAGEFRRWLLSRIEEIRACARSR